MRIHGLALKRTGITGIGIALNAQPRKYGCRHAFQTQNRELDEPRDLRDDTETKAISWPTYDSWAQWRLPEHSVGRTARGGCRRHGSNLARESDLNSAHYVLGDVRWYAQALTVDVVDSLRNFAADQRMRNPTWWD